MIKRSVNIILIVLILVSTIGVVINKHYSGGKLFSVSVYSEAASCCEEPCDCCTDESEFYQLDIDKNISQINIDFQSFSFEVFGFEKHLLNDIYNNFNRISLLKIENDISPPGVNNFFAFIQVFLF